MNRAWSFGLRFAAIAAMGLTPGAARADTVTLKNGREIHGRLVEEQREFIRMRSEGGVVRIEKSDIATFIENEETGAFGRRSQADIEKENEKRIRAEAAAAAPAAGDPATPGTPPANPATPPANPGTPPETPATPTAPARGGPTPARGATPTAETWVWPSTLTAEQIAALTPKRDAALAELVELGPSPEERLAAETCTSEERTAIQASIQYFNWRRRQGGTEQRRNNARDEVAGYGAKALPFLGEPLGSDAVMVARMAAQCVRQIAGGSSSLKADEARWLIYHHDMPTRLIALLDRQGDSESAFVRADAAAALAAATGHSEAWPQTDEAMRTPAETTAKEAWETWWGREKRRWTREQEQKAKKREDVLARLQLLREGKDPPASPTPATPATPPR